MTNFCPMVSIIIVHFDNQVLLLECLESCNGLTYPNHEIIVVTNGSKSQFALSELQAIAARVTVSVSSNENIGYSKANNLGIREALNHDANYILLLNDDTIVSPDFLNILVEEGERSAGAGILGPEIFYATRPKKIWFAGAKFDFKNCKVSTDGFDEGDGREDSLPVESDYISGCALLIKRSTIEKIGLLDERFFLYWEDVDWGLRAQRVGFKNIVVPSAKIWHKVSVSTGGMDSPLRAYHKTRSHLLFAKIHSPWALNKLYIGFLRNVAWLLLKPNDQDRVRKARAYISAIRDYSLERTDKGPKWLWEDL